MKINKKWDEIAWNQTPFHANFELKHKIKQWDLQFWIKQKVCLRDPALAHFLYIFLTKIYIELF